MVKHAGGALLLSIAIDRTSKRPVSIQLGIALRELILSGALNPGDRLPSSRTLADDLNISRTTVVSVFERLVSEELLESRTGTGTFVSDALKANRPKQVRNPTIGEGGERSAPRFAKATIAAVKNFSSRLPHPAEPKAFVTALPAFDAFPMALWSRLTTKHWRTPNEATMGYPDPQGFFPLRRAIATHLRTNRGVACEADQVFVVNGAQQAFNLIGSLLLDPMDQVWFENPGAIGARNSLVACGARLVPVPIDAYGIMVEEGLKQAPNFRLAFVTPSHQHPLGVTMSLERRFELLRAAEAADAWIIEDDYDGEFRYHGRPLPTLKSVDTAERVIYVGTFSKSLFPALRLGYLVVPPALVEIFQSFSNALLQGVSSNAQAVVAEFIEEGHFATHIRRMRTIYAERHQVFHEASKEKLAGMLDVAATETGFHTIGYLSPDLNEDAVATAAGDKNILVSPIGRFCIKPIQTQGLVLGFSSIKPVEIRDGVEVLSGVLREMSGRT